MKQLKLIQLYCTICHHYDTILAAEVQRLSNNFRPEFTDEECLAAVIFGIAEGKFEVKVIHRFIREYWADWFPKLPSYQNFNRRLNFLAPMLVKLYGLLLCTKEQSQITTHLLDSMPIVVRTRSEPRVQQPQTGCVIRDIAHQKACITMA